MIKFTNHSNKDLVIKKGMAFAQGIFINYLLTEDDNVNNIRNGGLGSTNG
jgi:dUTP pyrophosphatase